MQARARQAEARLQEVQSKLTEYERREQEVLAEKYKDKDAWIEMMTDPEQYQKFMRDQVQREIQQGLNQRDMRLQQLEMQERGMKAADDLRNFAYKEAGMKPEQLEAFLYEFSTPDQTGNMVPFMGLTPEKALETAKAIIRDRNFPQFAKKQREIAEREADMKRKEQLKKALPGGNAPAGPSQPQTDEEKYKSAVMGSQGSNPNEWLKA